MMFSLLVVAFPYIWRNLCGKPSFENSDQMLIEMVMAMPKMVFNMPACLLMLMVLHSIHRKMHLK